MGGERDYARLFNHLGVPIPREDLVQEAFRDESFVNENRGRGLLNNKKLALVGDAVVELAVRYELHVRNPEKTRDELSKLADDFVQDSFLAKAARFLEVGPLLDLGIQRRDQDNTTVLARAFEAMFATIFMSSGYEAAGRACVKSLFGPVPASAPA